MTAARRIAAALLLVAAPFPATAEEWGNRSSVAPVGRVPDAATAIRVAKEAWVPVYGKAALGHEPFTAELRQGFWHVSGSLPPDTLGGVPLARIDAATGEIRIWHSR